MNTGKTLQIDSGSLADTLALAEKIGRRVKGGETIELVSDLGGGKTAFVSGLAKGMGSRDSVSSPSFTLSNVYQADNISLHHFDFYRLSDPGILRDELAGWRGRRKLHASGGGRAGRGLPLRYGNRSTGSKHSDAFF